MSLALIAPASSQDQKLGQFYKLYREGNYPKALEELAQIKGGEPFEKTRSYLMALCYKNMQDYDRAVVFFKKAIKQGNANKDLFYEYGQTLYALNDLERASKAFDVSYKLGNHKTNSLYYIANIAELMENHSKTKTNYLKIIKDETADKTMKQIAYFKLGELLYNLVKSRFKQPELIRQYVWPLLDKAYELDPDSDIAVDIQRKLDQILIEFNMHPHILANGRRVSKNGWNFSVSYSYKTDDNVTLVNDQSSTTSTKRSSNIHEGIIFASHRWIFWKRWLFTPEVRYFVTKYSDRVNSDVFQNDGYSISPAGRNSFEHKLFGRRAGFLYDYEFNYTARDKEGRYRVEFYSRSTTHVVGERIRLLKEGDTTFKLKFKDFQSFSTSNNYKSTTLHVDQMYLTKSKNVFIFLFLGEMFDNHDDEQSTNSYLFRMDYMIPFDNWIWNFGLGETFLDTKKQSTTRGMEKTLSASGKLTWRLGKHTRLSGFYDYTKNSSKSTDYTYAKNVYGLELRLTY